MSDLLFTRITLPMVSLLLFLNLISPPANPVGETGPGASPEHPYAGADLFRVKPRKDVSQ